MTARRRLATLGSAVGLVAGLAAGALTVPGTVPPARAAASCTAPGPETSPVTAVGPDHPVVLVHGWGGYPMTRAARLLRQQLGDGWTPLVFDYRALNRQWPAASGAAACLADTIARYSEANRAHGGDGRVYLVGHSMGGVLIRFALSSGYAGRDVTPMVGGVVTLDTPHRGSPWADLAFSQLMRGSTAKMAPGAMTGNAARCLAPHGPGLPRLPRPCALPPYLPGQVPLAQISGDVTVRRDLFGAAVASVPLGSDGVVPTSSQDGYLGSGAGVRPLLGSGRVTSLRLDCTVSFADLDRAARAMKNVEWDGADAAPVFAVLRENGDGDAFDDLGRLELRSLPDVVRFFQMLAVTSRAAPCGHTNIPTWGLAQSAIATQLRIMAAR